jgi:hypothetical protein
MVNFLFRFGGLPYVDNAKGVFLKPVMKRSEGGF